MKLLKGLCLLTLLAGLRTAIAQTTLGGYSMAVGPAAGTNSIVLFDPTSSWTAMANVPWLQLSVSNGFGSTNLIFSYTTNAGATQVGTITIAGLTFTVTQAGSTYVQAPTTNTTIASIEGDTFIPGMAVDSSGNVYFASSDDSAIEEWIAASNTTITIVSNDNAGYPYGVAVDQYGNVYFSDTENNEVKEWSAANSNVSVLISGNQVGVPDYVAVDLSGNVYVSDSASNSVVEWVSAGSNVTTLITGLPASGPTGIAVDAADNVYFSTEENAALYEWTAANSNLSILATNQLLYVEGIAVDLSGNVYLASSYPGAIYEWSPVTGNLTNVVSGLSSPEAVAVDSEQNLYFTDNELAIDELPRAFVNTTGAIVTLAGGDYNLPGEVLPATESLLVPFTPASSQPWLTVLPPYSSNGVVFYDVSASSSNRSATLTILNVPVTITQAEIGSLSNVYAAVPTNGSAPLTVQFYGPTNDQYGNPVVSWNWQYPIYSTNQNPMYTFDSPGVYNPSLQIVDNQNNNPYITGPTITVTGGNAPATIQSYSWYSQLPIGPTGDSDIVDDVEGTPPFAYQWTFNGQPIAGATNSSYPFINVQLTNTGMYGVIVTNLYGTNTITNLPLAVISTNEYSAVPTSGQAPLPVQFTAPETDGYGNALTNWEWTFGDGGTSTNQDPYYTYSNTGNYSAQLNANNAMGELIYIQGPEISVSSSAQLGATNLVEGPARGMDGVVLACIGNWTASPNADWITLTNTSGTGSTNITFCYGCNTGCTRIGTITIAGLTLTVTQAGSNYTQTPNLLTAVASNIDEAIGAAVDPSGNVYFCQNNSVQEWIAASNTVVTLVNSGLSGPEDVALDQSGNIYIADTGDSAVKEWQVGTSNLITLVSNNYLNYPTGVAVDSSGNVYIADYNAGAVFEWTASNSIVSTIDNVENPYGVAVDAADNVYFSAGGYQVVEYSPATSNLGTVFQVDGPDIEAIALDGSGNIYACDINFGNLYEWLAVSNSVTALTSGMGTSWGVAVDLSRNIYIAEYSSNAITELPRAFVATNGTTVMACAGNGSLPMVLPCSENLLAPFAPISSQSWLCITGVTNDRISFHFTTNTGAQRCANISVLGLNVPVMQSASPDYAAYIPPQLGTTNLVEGPARGMDSVVLSCTSNWTASPNADWITLTNTSGTGSANITFCYGCNTGCTRIGTITIAGLTLTVTQAGSNYGHTPKTTTTLMTNYYAAAPCGAAVDGSGNVYFCDAGLNTVDEWVAANNTVLTLINGGLNSPLNVAVDTNGNLYIADAGDGAVKEWVATNGNLITLVDDTYLDYPTGVAVDGSGNVYIADEGYDTIFEWTAASNTVAALADADGPYAVAVDAAGNVYFTVGDFEVDEFLPQSDGDVVSVFSGDGAYYQALAVDGSGNIYVADQNNNAIDKWSAVNNTLTMLICGDNHSPGGLAVDGSRNIYVCDTDGDDVYELPRAFVATNSTTVMACAGNGSLPMVLPCSENLLAPFAPISSQSWLCITGITNDRISFHFTTNAGAQRCANISVLGLNVPVMQSASPDYSPGYIPPALGTTNLVEGPARGMDSVVLSCISNWTATPNVDWITLTNTSGTGSTNIVFCYGCNTGLTRIGTITINGLTLTVTQAGSNYVQTPSILTTLVSNGLSGPLGAAVDGVGNVYFINSADNSVKEWVAANNTVITLVTSGLSEPNDVAVDTNGNLYISDPGNDAVEEWVAANSNIVTLVNSDYLESPNALTLDTSGNVYVADGSDAIYEWTASNSTVSMLTSTEGNPQGITVDAAGNVYFSLGENVDEYSPVTTDTITIFNGFEMELSTIASDGSGNIYFLDTLSGRIDEVSAVSNTLVTLGNYYAGSAPTSIAVDSLRNIYLVNSNSNSVVELPRAFVVPTGTTENWYGSYDSLPVVLPANENLTDPFFPTSCQSWLSVTSVSNGVVNFSFAANCGHARTGYIDVLGQEIPIVQGAALSFSNTVVGMSNLLGFWPFTTDSQANSVVNGYTGIFEAGSGVGAPGSGPPVFNTPSNTSVALNGTNQWIVTSLSGQLTNNAGSIMAWFNLAALPSTSGNLFYIAGETVNGNDFDLQITPGNQIGFYTDCCGDATTSSNVLTTNDIGIWHFVAVTFTSGVSRNVYLDGQLVGSSTPGTHDPSGTGTFAIGQSDGFTNRFFQGALADVAVFNSQLTSDQVSALYQSSLGGYTITFDDLNPGQSNYVEVLNGYASLNWSNLWVLNSQELNAEDIYSAQPIGYTYGTISDPNVAYNYGGMPATVSSTSPFTMVSGYFTAAWLNNVALVVNGYNCTNLIYSVSNSLVTNSPSLINFPNVPVTQVQFTSTYQGEDTNGITQFALDNLTVIGTNNAVGTNSPMLAWNPALMASGAALSTNQLNATAATPGTFIYTPPLGTVLFAGTYTLSVVFTPNDPLAYASATSNITFEVPPTLSGFGATVLATSNLLGYWPFTTNSQANSVVNGFTGVFEAGSGVGAPGSGPPIAGTTSNTAVGLNGSSQWVPTSLYGDITNQGSIVAWFNLAALPSQEDGQAFYIAGEPLPEDYFDLKIGGNNQLQFSTGPASTLDATNYTFTTNDIGIWHFVTATFVSAGTTAIYLDGQLVASGVSDPYNLGDGEFGIGQSTYVGEGDEFFNGSLADVAVFSRALAGTEVSNLFLSALPEQGELITFDDLSGDETPITNGYHGLNWSDFYVADSSEYSDEGYDTGNISEPNVGFNGYGTTASISSSTPFALTSGYFTAAFDNGLLLITTGYNGGIVVYTQTNVLEETGPELISFPSIQVTEVDFVTSYEGEEEVNGEQFVVDNLSINGAGSSGTNNPGLVWNTPPPIPYPTPLSSNQLDATANTLGTFAYSVTNGTVLNAGTNNVTVIFTPNDSLVYAAASTNVNIVVTPAPLTVTASNAVWFKGQPMPALTGSLTGLVNGDNITVNFVTAATSNSPSGAYPIYPVFNDPSNRLANYTVTTNLGTLDLVTVLSVAIAAPTDDANYGTNGTVTVPVSVVVGTLYGLENLSLYNNSTLIASNASTNFTTNVTFASGSGYYLTAIATDVSNNTASASVDITVIPPGTTLIDFDDPILLNTANGAVGGASLATYLSNYGVTIGTVTLGATLETLSDPDFTAISTNELPVAPSEPNFLTLVGSPQNMSFTLNFTNTNSVQSVTFTQIGVNTNGKTSMSYPSWAAYLLDQLGNEEPNSVIEPLITNSTNNIPAHTFTIYGTNINGVRFQSLSQQAQSDFPAVLLDNLLISTNGLTGPAPLSITLTNTGGPYTNPATITLSATINDTYPGANYYVNYYDGPTLLGTNGSTFIWSNVFIGTYTVTAQVVDSNGYAVISAPLTVTVQPGAGATWINFDSVNASNAPVAASNYLSGYGVTLATNTSNTSVVIENQNNVAGGGYVIGSSQPNILTQTNLAAPMSFTLTFSNWLTQFTFTRPELTAPNSGFVTHPAWQLSAYDPLGNLLSSAQEPVESTSSSSQPVPAKTYTLTGPGIASITFNSEGDGKETFPGMLMDDFILQTGTSVVITNPLANSTFPINESVGFYAGVSTASNVTVTNVSFYVLSNGVTHLFASTSNAPYLGAWFPSQAGSYSVTAVAADSTGLMVTSTPVAISETLASGFGILTPPASQTIARGASATFTVITTTTNGVTYQWDENGSPVSGATLSAFTISNAAVGTNTNTVVVTSSGQSITSLGAVLTVLGPPTVSAVTYLPVDISPTNVPIGSNITLVETATDPGIPLTYQWRLNGTGIPGATNNSYTISNAQPLNSGNYTVVVANPVASSNSPSFPVGVNIGSGALLTANTSLLNSQALNPYPLAPNNESPPGLPVAGVNSNSPATDAIVSRIAGKRAGHFLWFSWTPTNTGLISLTTEGSSFDTLLGVYTTNVANPTSSSQLTSIAENDDFQGGYFTSLVNFNYTSNTTYFIAVAGFHNAVGDVILGLPSSTSYIPSAGETLPVITQQPANELVVPGTNVTLFVAATNATSYQWYFGGAPLAVGGQSTNLVFTNFPASAVGNYWVEAINAVGGVQSQTVVIELATNGNLYSPTNLLVDKFSDAQDVATVESPDRFHIEALGGDVGGFTLSQSFSTVGATKEEDEPNHAGQPGGASYWYTYIAPESGTIQFDTTGSAFPTILAIYTASTLPAEFNNLTEVGSSVASSTQSQPALVISNVVGDETEFFIAVDGVDGASGSVHLNITYKSIFQPTLASSFSTITNNGVNVNITYPPNGYVTSSSTVAVRGTISAQGDNSVSNYSIYLTESNLVTNAVIGASESAPHSGVVEISTPGGGEEFVSESGITWSAKSNATLNVGPNYITVQGTNVVSTNVEGATRPVTHVVYYVQGQSRITLQTASTNGGTGKITGMANNALLDVGRVYKVTAVPGNDSILTNWTSNYAPDGAPSTNGLTNLANTPVLYFTMFTNLVLQANFMSNPFPAVAGIYSGLFTNTNGLTENSSGYLKITVPSNSKGAYSGKVLVDGDSYPISGSFAADGTSDKTVNRSGGNTPLTVDLLLDLTGTNDQLTGTVSGTDGTNGWSSQLQAYHSSLNTRTNAAKFTLIVPTNGFTNGPGGVGYLTVSENASGNAAIAGHLGDGANATESTPVAANGYIPLYVSLYSHEGVIEGWLTLTNSSNTSTIVGSNLFWIKLYGKNGAYTGGFTNTNITIIGSSYSASDNVLATLTNLSVTVGASNIAPLVYSNLVISGNKFSSATSDPNYLSGSITPATGAISLTFRPSGDSKDTHATGVILQQTTLQTNGGGWFLDGDQTGSFLLQQ